MLRGSTAAALWLACTSVGFAHGAVLQDKVGVVLVDSGEGFVAAENGRVLAPTDMVTIRPRSTAFLVYKDGCRTKLTPGRTVTVGSTACAESRELADLPEPAPAPAPIIPAADPGFGLPLVGGVVVVGAGVGVAIALSSHHDNNFPTPPTPRPRQPVSP